VGIFDSLDLDDANKIKDKQVFIRFGNGTTKCEVLSTGAMRTFKSKAPLFLMDFKVLETTDPELNPGDVVNFSQNPTTEWGLKTSRNFCVAAAGLLPGNPDDQPLIDKEHWGNAIKQASNNPKLLAGAIVIAESQKAVSRNDNSYSKVTFTASPETRAKRIAMQKKSA
jgi:hypothetical protein